jgi:flagellar basal body-associated protein FliL
MSDKKKESAPAEAPKEEAKPAKKGLPIKTIGIIGAIMAIEAGALFFVLGGLGGPKKSEAAVDPKHVEVDESQEVQEIEIVSEKFQNMTTGKVWVWDISLFVQVRQKNAERVEKVLEQRGAELKEGLSQIVSRAQHAQLKEPERQSLNRQFSAFLEKVVGMDADNKPLIDRVLIPKCRGFPADF